MENEVYKEQARTINIRSIQHYMYCPRRFALLEINDDWAENAFVVKANLMHENVHSGSRSFESKEKIVRSDVALYCDAPELDIFGVADCIEFVRKKSGAYIEKLGENFDVDIVEYKPRKPKSGEYNESDAIQVYAQKICADSIFGCNCNAYIYYGDVRRRVKLPFDGQEREKYDGLLRKYLREMREILQSGEIPQRARGQKCSGCSLADMCFPKVKKYSVKEIVMSMNDAQ